MKADTLESIFLLYCVVNCFVSLFIGWFFWIYGVVLIMGGGIGRILGEQIFWEEGAK